MFADLHIHSWYSDGTLNPEEIVKKAKTQNINLISICDHNLIDAYAELEKLCADNDIKFITGVEINALMDDTDYHILAYGFDMQDKDLTELLKYNRNVFIDMGNKLIEKISADYPSVSLKEYLKYERNRRNGGWESIDYLISKRIIENHSDFHDFRKKYGASPDKDFLSPVEVIKIIHNARGYAILAHLGLYNEDNIKDCENTATQFSNMGIDGFECYYPLHTDEITSFIVNFCRERDLMITAGSDEHGGFNGEEFYIGAVKIKIEQLNLKNLIK